MLENVIDIEHQSMLSSLRHSCSALVLFDFRAAFPSVSQDFLFAVMEYLGLPVSAVNVLAALYDNNRCEILINGETYLGFSMASGIRQGCPLSPLLFAAVADLLLRTLQKSPPHSSTRAFADDTAMFP